MNYLHSILCLSVLSLTLNSMGQETYLVPSEVATIQLAIDGAVNGDTIIVAEGIYYENIDYSGKEVYLSSEYLYTADPSTISNTIIDGSQAQDPDTASVVRIVNGEGPSTVLRGFTITHGNGTRTYNIIEDFYFRTGGGISCDQSSPTIIDNIIIDNHCDVTPNVLGAGGGGLRVGFGQPYIARNIITQNTGGYAGGIMIAYCEGMFLENNVISYNHAAGDFGGGGGVYVDWENINIINNTIVNNSSDGTGGGLCLTGNSSTIHNCIIQNNTASTPNTESIRIRFGGNPMVDYTNIGGDWTGDANIDIDPLFLDTLIFELDALSPSVDTGDPIAVYNDIEDPNAPGMALAPAKGTIHNDMGAHGGQGYQLQAPNAVFDLDLTWDLPATLGEAGLIVTLDEPLKLRVSVYDFLAKLLYVSDFQMYQEGKSTIQIEAMGAMIIEIQDEYGRVSYIKGIR